MSAVSVREIGMLMAGQAPPHLNHLLAAGRIGSRRDPGVRLHILKRLARILQIRNHRADLNRLIALRFLEPLAGEMLPEPEKSRHLRRWPEVLRIPQPRIEPIEANLARHMPQARADFWQCASRLRLLEE